MLKLEAALGVAVFLLWVFCLVEVIGTREGAVRHLEKTWWILIVLFFPLAGSIAWLVAGRPETHQRPTNSGATSFGEYDRPGRAAGATQESDEEFLRRCRERAEQQRKQHRDAQPESGKPDSDH